ncbi:MAG: TetR family transcriptional regulator [Pseudonocardia sp.]
MAFTERSRQAREAILASARRRFGERGYNRTTIRGVARDAQVDPSLVIRYYGSKERLFTAATVVDLRLPDVAAIRADAREEVIARHILTSWTTDDSGLLAVLLRSAITHEAAAERLRAVISEQVTPMVRVLSGGDAHAEVRAGLLGSHLLGIALARYVLHIPPVAELDDEDLVGLLTATLRRVSSGPLPWHDVQPRTGDHGVGRGNQRGTCAR